MGTHPCITFVGDICECGILLPYTFNHRLRASRYSTILQITMEALLTAPDSGSRGGLQGFLTVLGAGS